jgi:hypothetical protein
MRQMRLHQQPANRAALNHLVDRHFHLRHGKQPLCMHVDVWASLTLCRPHVLKTFGLPQLSDATCASDAPDASHTSPSCMALHSV